LFFNILFLAGCNYCAKRLIAFLGGEIDTVMAFLGGEIDTVMAFLGGEIDTVIHRFG
jgi:hypothetical protein